MEYLSSRIATANEAQLVAIVYEGLIKSFKDSIVNIENKDDSLLNESINKSRNIIAELIATLKGDSEIAINYKSIYMYLNKLITTASIYKEIQTLEEAIEVVTPLYEGWSELGEKMFLESIEKGQTGKIVAGMTYGKGYVNDDSSSGGSTFEA